MSLILYLIVLAIVGLFVGALGRLFVPGPDPMGIGATILVGLAASFLAGLVVWALFGHGGGGIVLSVLFAMLIVWLMRRFSYGGTGGRRRRTF